MMYLVVTAPAQAHKVIVGVPAAFGDRQNMMHLFSRSHPTFGITPLTVRVSRIVSVTDALPGASVFFMHIRRAFVFIVFLPCLLAVLLAVLTVCQPWAAGVGARTLRISRHSFHIL